MGPFLGSVPDHRLFQTRLGWLGQLDEKHDPHDRVWPLHSTAARQDVFAFTKAATSDAHCQVQANVFCQQLLLVCRLNCHFVLIDLRPWNELLPLIGQDARLIRKHWTTNSRALHLFCSRPRPSLSYCFLI